MRRRYFYKTLFFVLLSFSGYGQHRISGFIEADKKNKAVYISLLKYNEESAIYTNQILRSVLTDSTGFFEFTGKILPKENMLYRIHANLDETKSGLEFYQDSEYKNYHNFIFSNTDTISFPKSSDFWFVNSQNTNPADLQWRNLLKYREVLREEYTKIKDAEALTNAKQSFLNELKLYCIDSLSSPLVRLLAFGYFKDDHKVLKKDFEQDPDFYYDLQHELNKDYSGTSYSSQFQDEISKLSTQITNQKYIFHKRLNYILALCLALSFMMMVYLSCKLKSNKKQAVTNEAPTLTSQEEKVAKLIYKGMSNKDIASNLFISLNTVKSHISSLYAKTGVANRQQLIKKMKNHTWD